MNKLIKTLIATCILVFTYEIKVYGNEEIMEMFDFGQVEEVIDESNYNMDFEETIRELSTGESKGIFYNIFNYVFDGLFKEIMYNKEVITRIIILGISSAILTNISLAFVSSKIPDTGFFVIYCLLITVMMSGFAVITGMLSEVISTLLGFMEVIIPAFFLSMGITGAYTSQSLFCQVVLFSIAAVEYIIKIIIVPGINMYVVLMLINSLVDEDYVSKFAEVIKSAILWILKGMMMVIAGINIVQSIIAPAIDSATTSGAKKIVSLIPGIGNATSAVGEIITGSANVIKNAMGGAILIFIIILVAVPVIKSIVFVVMYKLTTALLQPVTDKRIVKAVDGVANGAILSYKAMVSCAGLFALSVAIMCISTNLK